jgi:membrane associated rhomboid family serine protease
MHKIGKPGGIGSHVPFLSLIAKAKTMGLQDRNYYDDRGRDPWSTDPDAWKGGSGGGGRFGGSRGSIIKVIIIINVVIFLIDAFIAAPQEKIEAYSQAVKAAASQEEAEKIQKPARWLMGTLALKPDVIQKPWNVWQLLTHGFAHASIDSPSTFFHVGFNMVTLFFLGVPVERKYGRDEFLRFYLSAIVVSGLGWLIAKWLTGTYFTTAVGASGAVSAVIALFIFNYWNEKIYLFGVLGLKAWVLGLLLIGSDLLRALNPENSVAWEAHLAGMAFGAAYFHFKWNFSWLKMGWLAALFSSKPKLKVHNPQVKDEALKEQADQILEKIAEHGEGSLSGKERRILNKYSKSLRDQRSD